jgi:hypothetical protein
MIEITHLFVKKEDAQHNHHAIDDNLLSESHCVIVCMYCELTLNFVHLHTPLNSSAKTVHLCTHMPTHQAVPWTDIS